ncbi:amidohydrolase family protein [Streptomyces bambusae]|uniref:amidohydrolase family protein n=1 Tax=Streptomyces bambusae TaxID=1550616 RepID=UPI0027DFA8C5|nr:amidohydrolase family protein [Streptomyces bambusae]
MALACAGGRSYAAPLAGPDDPAGARAEAVHALDELGSDGVTVLSNAYGRYLGDPDFEPLWAELDPRLRPGGATPEDLLAELRRFWFDTAFCAGPASLPSLLAFAAPGRLLYGSDFPMLPEEWCSGYDDGLDGYPHWEDGQLHAVHRGNAELVVPRLARA